MSKKTKLQKKLASMSKGLGTVTGTIWNPNAGDCLSGVIVGWSEATSQYETFPVMILKDTEERNWQVGLNKWLQDQIKRHQAKKGCLVALRFEGKNKSANGNNYNAYAIDVECPNKE